MFGFLKKVFGTAQSRMLKKYEKIVSQINKIEEKFALLSEEEIKQKTIEFRERLKKGETLESILPEAYAVVKNVCRRLCGTEIHVSGYQQKWDMIPYDVQMLGAISMHYGAIAEMQTGEGKTLTSAMPLYLNALTEKPVHLVTVNDYLVQRDCDWIGSIFRYLGLRVEALTNSTPHYLRKHVYAADIVYGTASEFGFDYLRDNSMAHSKEEQAQRGYYFAIIDEVDSILIDEARTPLIISGPTSHSRQMYDLLKEGVAHLVRLQRDLCTKIASEAKKMLDDISYFSEGEKKLSKEQEKVKEEALRKLWLVGKGTPQNKILKRAKENPDARSDLEKWEVYYHGESNKEEKEELLSDLFVVIDERAQEYEVTDKGIVTWSEFDKAGSHGDFLMLDLGHEYAEIDALDVSEEVKIQKKALIREEDAQRKERAHNLRQLLRAHLLMEKDIDYIIQEGKIVIIDENTGRPQPGRRFSDGLHQAIEAKEMVAIQQETQTYATVTLQNYFRMYKKCAGMTGTALTEAMEFKEIYKLQVVEIPTHKKCKRIIGDDQIYMTEREKYQAMLKEIKEFHEKGRPILIGTESVDVSEKLSRILKQNHLEHTVLNAKNHAKEAEIIAAAGKRGAITVATNMAGRGTDIKLEEGVAERGGLHVVGATRHHSRRVDLQLSGRSARQGDPGSAQFFLSFEGELLRFFTSPSLTMFLKRVRPPEGEAVSAKILNKSIRTAQKRIEQRNYSIRKHTLEYDDVMNKQRQEIYAFRNQILHVENVEELSVEVIKEAIGFLTKEFFERTENERDEEKFFSSLMMHFPVTFEKTTSLKASKESVEEGVSEKILQAFRRKIEHQIHLIELIQKASENEGRAPDRIVGSILRSILLGTIDRYWQEHLLAVDHLRSEVSLRSIAQKDPLVEFKHEAFALFESLSQAMTLEIAHALFRFEVRPPEPTLSSSIEKIQLRPRKGSSLLQGAGATIIPFMPQNVE